jgi:hypothetical protein
MFTSHWLAELLTCQLELQIRGFLAQCSLLAEACGKGTICPPHTSYTKIPSVVPSTNLLTVRVTHNITTFDHGKSVIFTLLKYLACNLKH